MQCHISLCFSSVRALHQSGQQEQRGRGSERTEKEMLRENM